MFFAHANIIHGEKYLYFTGVRTQNIISRLSVLLNKLHMCNQHLASNKRALWNAAFLVASNNKQQLILCPLQHNL